jgi:hypothetical protein
MPKILTPEERELRKKEREKKFTEISKERYKNDEEYRTKMLERQKTQKAEKYANDPEYREKIKEVCRERYRNKKALSSNN